MMYDEAFRLINRKDRLDLVPMAHLNLFFVKYKIKKRLITCDNKWFYFLISNKTAY